MPTIYRVCCERCDDDPTGEPPRAPALETGAAAYLEYEPSSVRGSTHGLVTQGWYRAVLAKDGHLVPLRHPHESSSLLEAGHTWLTASVSGRLVYVNQVICRDCGTIDERVDLTFFSLGLGCLGVLGTPPLFLYFYGTGSSLGVLAMGRSCWPRPRWQRWD